MKVERLKGATMHHLQFCGAPSRTTAMSSPHPVMKLVAASASKSCQVNSISQISRILIRFRGVMRVWGPFFLARWWAKKENQWHKWSDMGVPPISRVKFHPSETQLLSAIKKGTPWAPTYNDWLGAQLVGIYHHLLWVGPLLPRHHQDFFKAHLLSYRVKRSVGQIYTKPLLQNFSDLFGGF